MEKLTKKEIVDLFDQLLITNSNIPNQLIVDFKSKVIEIVETIQDEVIKAFHEEDNIVIEKITNFFEVAKNNKSISDPLLRNYGYLSVDIPIILPMEVLAMCTLLDKHFLPVAIAKISEMFVNYLIDFTISESTKGFSEDILLVDLMKNADKSKTN
jgi:hypothetical protein